MKKDKEKIPTKVGKHWSLAKKRDIRGAGEGGEKGQWKGAEGSDQRLMTHLESEEQSFHSFIQTYGIFENYMMHSSKTEFVLHIMLCYSKWSQCF